MDAMKASEQTSEDIKIGDWVRWEHGDMADNWVEGEVMRIPAKGIQVDILVAREGAGRHQSKSLQLFGLGNKSIIHRILRPNSDFIVKRTLDGEAVIEAVYRDPDPLDVMYDGVMLRTLLDGDAYNRHEHGRGLTYAKPLTTAQRAAVSAHWSAELRRKVSEAKERERCVVSYSEWEPGE